MPPPLDQHLTEISQGQLSAKSLQADYLAPRSQNSALAILPLLTLLEESLLEEDSPLAEERPARAGEGRLPRS